MSKIVIVLRFKCRDKNYHFILYDVSCEALKQDFYAEIVEYLTDQDKRWYFKTPQNFWKASGLELVQNVNYQFAKNWVKILSYLVIALHVSLRSVLPSMCHTVGRIPSESPTDPRKLNREPDNGSSNPSYAEKKSWIGE